MSGPSPWRRTFATVTLVAALLAGCGDEDEDGADPAPAAAHFGYEGDQGPADWASLDPAYEACATGTQQSPIDLAGPEPGEPPEVEFGYRPGAAEAENNGHSVEVEVAPGSVVEVGGVEYELDQFHFHAPSEHLVDGRELPLEFHFVNLAPDGSAVVFGVLVERGQPNPAFDPLIEALPAAEGEAEPVPGEVDALDLLPPDPDSARRWTYEGSLTTPPCTEGVAWNVFERPVELSAEQIDAYTGVYDNTNRPVQPLNGRELSLGS